MCRFRVSVFVWTHVYGWVSEVFSEWRVCVCVSAVKCEVVSESMAMKEKQERKLYSIPSGVRVPGSPKRIEEAGRLSGSLMS